jgi:hypothetical protein
MTKEQANDNLQALPHDKRQQLASLGLAQHDKYGEWRFTTKGLNTLRTVKVNVSCAT